MPTGRFVTREGRRLYVIDRVDQMPPFLMTVVGDSDLWLYLSSAGGLTAGRVEPDRCLFPYETDDRLHCAAGITGPVTVIRFADGSSWRPFDSRALGDGRTRRLLRSPIGDVVIFEETDARSGLTFRSEWALSDRFGIIRSCALELDGAADPIGVEIIDGLLNIMPANVLLGLQQGSSTLVDAYKRSELDPRTGLATYCLESAISDRPEPCESLRANVVWRAGLDDARVSVDPSALRRFEQGLGVEGHELATGRRGAYLCGAAIDLEPGDAERWTFAADTHLDHRAVAGLNAWLRSAGDRAAQIEGDLTAGRDRLGALLDRADGSQVTADESATSAHRSNVLFNAMRGGTPADGYGIRVADFRDFLKARHQGIASRHDDTISQLGDRVTLETLLATARASADPQLVRLALEYLPLTFGRRHGDPSRPWNRFRIRMRTPDGAEALGYEGNWRDIFQNWEAMSFSYPDFLPNMIAKFVNASTPDGHNPYRISDEGIDWETLDPADPWSNIGYWGDHQLIYLLRLLEQLRDTNPAALDGMLEEPVFSYANVPYRIRSFDEIVANPRASIRFDEQLDGELRSLARADGSDAKLVLDALGEPALVTLIEKLMAPALAKVSNFVPGGGVWMNLQRPEWNDANNALAGYGLSMVTLYQLRSYAQFALEVVGAHEGVLTQVSDAVAAWCNGVSSEIERWLSESASGAESDPGARWRFLRAVGTHAEAARDRVARRGLGPMTTLELSSVKRFFELTRDLCDRTIERARRDDGLFHSYNVLRLDPAAGSAEVDHLHLMLEGNVAVLGSGVLSTEASADLIEALFDSPLYREDQRTFMLAPRIDRTPFVERNVIPESAVEACRLLRRILDEGAVPIAARDANGRARFNADLVTRATLDSRLETLASDARWRADVAEGAAGVRDAYEQTFGHARFTGRSGTMHKYEGIGSVYWHMVSKLLLATQEAALRRDESGGPASTRIVECYRRVRDGLGPNKTPDEFGAVPHEPYSHTPWNAGAQQPGMTGQVKEGVICRFRELGLRYAGGRIEFTPRLPLHAELLTEPADWHVHGNPSQRIQLEPGSIGFTVCGTPVVIMHADETGATVHLADGERVEFDAPHLDERWSREIFGRTGRAVRVEVRTPVP
ncbi:MAG: hypothetical protein RIB32_00155 [Phycisphaerales bacterium]